MRLPQGTPRVIAKVRDHRSDATGRNQVWATDWVFDGRRLWVLTVVDSGAGCARSCASVDR
jgi:hypothetical protein